MKKSLVQIALESMSYWSAWSACHFNQASGLSYPISSNRNTGAAKSRREAKKRRRAV